MKISELLMETMSASELRWLDDLADRLFNQLGIDVEFTKHFFDRANDERSEYRDQQGRKHEQGITAEELARVFVAAYKQAAEQNSKYVKVTDIPPNAEATIRDHFTKINIPFVMKKAGGQKILTPKTVMRKDNFANPPGTKAVPVNSKNVALGEGTMKPTEVSGKEKPGAVECLKKVLLVAKEQGEKLDYDGIDKIMQKICHRFNLTGDKLHDDFVAKVGQIPDDWIKMKTESNSKYLGATEKVKINKKGWQIPLNKRGFGAS